MKDLFIHSSLVSLMGGQTDDKHSWTEVVRRGRNPKTSTSSSSSSSSATPPSPSPAGGKPATRKDGGKAKRAFRTVFSSSVAHTPLEYVEEVPIGGAPPSTSDTFVVGVTTALRNLNPTLQHEVRPGVEAGWVDAKRDVEQMRSERKGRTFLALRPSEHAPPGSELRRHRGFITVAVPTSVHRGGGILVPREWSGCDWWAKAVAMTGVAAAHVRGDGRLDLIPGPNLTVAVLANSAEGSGLKVDRVVPPEGRKFYLTCEKGEAVPVTAVALALKETVANLEKDGLVPLGNLSLRKATQCIMPLLQIRPGNPAREIMVAGMRVRVAKARVRGAPQDAGGGPGGSEGAASGAAAGGGEGADGGASKDPAKAASRGPMPRAVVRKVRERAEPEATPALPREGVVNDGVMVGTATAGTSAPMALDDDWAAEDVAGIDGSPNYTVYADKKNPVPAEGPGGFAAAMAATAGDAARTRAVTAVLGETAAGSPGVVDRVVQLGSSVVAPLLKMAFARNAECARKAIGLDGGPTDIAAVDACFELCKMMDDKTLTRVTAGSMYGQGPLPPRWTQLLE